MGAQMLVLPHAGAAAILLCLTHVNGASVELRARGFDFALERRSPNIKPSVTNNKLWQVDEAREKLRRREISQPDEAAGFVLVRRMQPKPFDLDEYVRGMSHELHPKDVSDVKHMMIEQGIVHPDPENRMHQYLDQLKQTRLEQQREEVESRARSRKASNVADEVDHEIV